MNAARTDLGSARAASSPSCSASFSFSTASSVSAAESNCLKTTASPGRMSGTEYHSSTPSLCSA